MQFESRTPCKVPSEMRTVLMRICGIWSLDNHDVMDSGLHLAAIDRYGPCPVHRRSFAPVRELRLPGM